jgi:hypothetical protein
VIGLLTARGLGGYVSTLLFEVTVNDPDSYMVSATVLITVAIAASLLAGRRATRIDPTEASDTSSCETLPSHRAKS